MFDGEPEEAAPIIQFRAFVGTNLSVMEVGLNEFLQRERVTNVLHITTREAADPDSERYIEIGVWFISQP